jgi:hypothetical protein
MAKRKRSPLILLTAKDWTEIFYAVELKRLHVAKDNRKNGRYSDDGVDLDAWRWQMQRIADVLDPDGKRMYHTLTNLIESADRVVSRWAEADLQFAVQDLDAALARFGFGTRRGGPKYVRPANPRRQSRRYQS